jgi:hypothetical protein
VIDTDQETRWSKRLHRAIQVERTQKKMFLMDLNQLWQSEESTQITWHERTSHPSPVVPKSALKLYVDEGCKEQESARQVSGPLTKGSHQDAMKCPEPTVSARDVHSQSRGPSSSRSDSLSSAAELSQHVTLPAPDSTSCQVRGQPSPGPTVHSSRS